MAEIYEHLDTDSGEYNYYCSINCAESDEIEDATEVSISWILQDIVGYGTRCKHCDKELTIIIVS